MVNDLGAALISQQEAIRQLDRPAVETSKSGAITVATATLRAAVADEVRTVADVTGFDSAIGHSHKRTLSISRTVLPGRAAVRMTQRVSPTTRRG